MILQTNLEGIGSQPFIPHRILAREPPKNNDFSLTALALGLPVDQKKGDNRITTGNTAQKSERGPWTKILLSEIVFRHFCAKIIKS